MLSTGGEVDPGRGVTTPGVALYHEGLDLIAIVSTMSLQYIMFSVKRQILGCVILYVGPFGQGREFPQPCLSLLAEYYAFISLVQVSTGDDVYELRVRGPLANRTWTNVGVRWEPFDGGRVSDHKGGLEVSQTIRHMNINPL